MTHVPTVQMTRKERPSEVKSSGVSLESFRLHLPVICKFRRIIFLSDGFHLCFSSHPFCLSHPLALGPHRPSPYVIGTHTHRAHTHTHTSSSSSSFVMSESALSTYSLHSSVSSG